ncbi:MAG: metal ABC transporter permease [Acidimicrobiales bacterium]
MTASLAPVFEPGFFSSGPVHVALIVGGVSAVVSAVVGVFTVIRGQSFAGHALSDIGTAGGSAAVLVGVSTFYGYVALNVVAAGVMELIGIRRPRGRDLATGIVLGVSLGLAALFLYEDTVTSTTTGATVSVLFGSIFALPPSTVPVIAVLASIPLALIVVLYRPLLLTSVSSDLAAARRVPIRLVGIGYLLALALAVSLSAVTIGAILSTALLIGPAATSLRCTTRTGVAIAAAAGLGLGATWVGTLIAYDSAVWTGGQGWPVSFCVVAVVFALYLSSAVPARLRRARRHPGRPGRASRSNHRPGIVAGRMRSGPAAEVG